MTNFNKPMATEGRVFSESLTLEGQIKNRAMNVYHNKTRSGPKGPREIFKMDTGWDNVKDCREKRVLRFIYNYYDQTSFRLAEVKRILRAGLDPIPETLSVVNDLVDKGYLVRVDNPCDFKHSSEPFYQIPRHIQKRLQNPDDYVTFTK